MIMRSFFLLSTAALLSWSANVNIASGSFPNTHTQHTPKLKPASLDLNPQGAYKIASVCFLGGNCGNDGGFNKGGDDYQIDTALQCKNEGYTVTSCSLPSYPDVQCPYNSTYYAKCTEDKPRACKDSGYSLNCGDGQVIDTSQTCPYDNSYKKCKCAPCDGYNYTYAEATTDGYVAGASCNTCGKLKYQRQNAPCNGFLSCSCGGDTGASTCKSGTNTLFSSCASCCTCAGTNPSCPSNRPYYDGINSTDACGNICSLRCCRSVVRRVYTAKGCRDHYGRIYAYGDVDFYTTPVGESEYKSFYWTNTNFSNWNVGGTMATCETFLKSQSSTTDYYYEDC